MSAAILSEVIIRNGDPALDASRATESPRGRPAEPGTVLAGRGSALRRDYRERPTTDDQRDAKRRDRRKCGEPVNRREIRLSGEKEDRAD